MRLSLVEKEDAGAAQGLFEQLEQKQGKVLNLFKIMAHKPEVANKFAAFYSALWAEGELPAKLRELAYLRTSIRNGCDY